MHPLLQPTRKERIVNRAIDTAAVIFWTTFGLILAATIVLATLGAVFGVGPAV